MYVYIYVRCFYNVEESKSESYASALHFRTDVSDCKHKQNTYWNYFEYRKLIYFLAAAYLAAGFLAGAAFLCFVAAAFLALGAFGLVAGAILAGLALTVPVFFAVFTLAFSAVFFCH